jgi:hypothetical protein
MNEMFLCSESCPCLAVITLSMHLQRWRFSSHLHSIVTFTHTQSCMQKLIVAANANHGNTVCHIVREIGIHSIEAPT